MSCNCPTNGNFPDDQTGCGGNSSCSQKCHEVVDTASQLSIYRNAFVTVRNENATYHVDEVGNPLLITRAPIFAGSDYTPTIGDYRQVIVYKFSANRFYVFDPTGAFKTGTLS